MAVRRCCETVQGTRCCKEQHRVSEAMGVGVDDKERRGNSVPVDGCVWAFGVEGETEVSRSE